MLTSLYIFERQGKTTARYKSTKKFCTSKLQYEETITTTQLSSHCSLQFEAHVVREVKMVHCVHLLLRLFKF